ncbi:biotin biosynthesis protein BioC [Pontibacillus halophilus JSM 076056 = DSM 19796]|uniref:Biotin transporter n=1 Tax=Pontibacillus halophilus JSM 076056 = DSM 19796 TaxID=1385510 RepID=A0A0A5GML8_9BACI|nr:biotin transporter BioY [Pontibacillus halophilus]KGX92468.1 biotin biosynthesis protein BioC [Pontibacillus halophilus JSM 076056 = DSM 19796]
MSKSKFTTLDLTLGAMFVALMAIGANITSYAPFLQIWNVPLTLQTFVAILAGIVLGSRMGAISLCVYLLVGLAGAPVFARFGAGFDTLVTPTFGFILSYILLAYVVGKIVEHKRSLPIYIFATVVGLIINYVVGVNWLYGAYVFWVGLPDGYSYTVAWMGMAPFLVKDLALAIVAAFFGYRLERSVLQNSQFRRQKSA